MKWWLGTIFDDHLFRRDVGVIWGIVSDVIDERMYDLLLNVLIAPLQDIFQTDKLLSTGTKNG